MNTTLPGAYYILPRDILMLLCQLVSDYEVICKFWNIVPVTDRMIYWCPFTEPEYTSVSYWCPPPPLASHLHVCFLCFCKQLSCDSIIL